MKKLVLICMILATAALVFAQETPSIAEPDPTIIGADSAKMALQEVSLDRFERDGQWNTAMSSDNGVIIGRLFDGSPAAKEPVEGADDQELNDSKVFGAKAEFFHRGTNSFYITASRAIPIEGVTKVISVWVCGRNQSHDLSILVRDYNGNNFELYVGSLNFSGWKKMQVAVPPSTASGTGIVQSSEYFGDRPGLSVIGFRVDCNPEYAIGSYYIYFDDLRAITDLYSVENRDIDDMDDNW